MANPKKTRRKTTNYTEVRIYKTAISLSKEINTFVINMRKEFKASWGLDILNTWVRSFNDIRNVYEEKDIKKKCEYCTQLMENLRVVETYLTYAAETNALSQIKVITFKTQYGELLEQVKNWLSFLESNIKE